MLDNIIRKFHILYKDFIITKFNKRLFSIIYYNYFIFTNYILIIIILNFYN